jgi:hypothetical protein
MVGVLLKEMDLKKGLIRAGSCAVDVGFDSSYMYRAYKLFS